MRCLAARDRALAAHIPAANTMSRGTECKDTPEVNRGADDESRPRGLDHGVVALCLLSYIRICESHCHPVAACVSRQIVKERSPLPVCDPVDRCIAAAGRDAL
jgi:hypothetical protein